MSLKLKLLIIIGCLFATALMVGVMVINEKYSEDPITDNTSNFFIQLIYLLLVS